MTRRTRYGQMNPPGNAYLPRPPRCPVHGTYMPFRYQIDMYVCRDPHPGGRHYYVTAEAWQRHLAGECDLGFLADPVPVSMPRLGLSV